jgi:diamine N-acetyltransferase
VQLRPTESCDLEFVVAAEHARENRRWIIPWSRERHEASLASPDIRHFIAERLGDRAPVGYAILAGARDDNASVELRRLVIAEKSVGSGRTVVQIIQRLAFDELGAHRLWLDVKEDNDVARRLYTSEGFVTEGVLRECVKTEDGYDSLVVMSILRGEFTQRRPPGGSAVH